MENKEIEVKEEKLIKLRRVPITTLEEFQKIYGKDAKYWHSEKRNRQGEMISYYHFRKVHPPKPLGGKGGKIYKPNKNRLRYEIGDLTEKNCTRIINYMIRNKIIEKNIKEKPKKEVKIVVSSKELDKELGINPKEMIKFELTKETLERTDKLADEYIQDQTRTDNVKQLVK